MDYGKIMKFKGTWRNYQARVLQSSDRYLKDGKIHIVAAPGSGKTTLGIELIARLGRPALVLAPSITIREQWVSRIIEGFLNEGIDAGAYLSQDLKNPKVITVVTYQSLHSAMTRYKGKEKSVGDEEEAAVSEKAPAGEQEVDYSGFDVVSAMKACQLGTVCLDECHHLRAEWWKALEEFRSAIGSVKVIALTATPPYDSTPAFWKRYMDMCGEIDEEITIPELVKEGSLCPHQDYVYFNYPTDEETGEIAKFSMKSREVYEKLISDAEFKNAVATHGSLKNEEEAFEGLLADVQYMNAFLTYLGHHNLPFPKGLSKPGRNVSAMTPGILEKLLQGFLYDDCQAYHCGEYQEALAADLKSQGLIEKKKVSLTANAAVEKLLTNSKGKITSIQKIVESEFKNLGKELRMLVLTDYIRKEYEKLLGDEGADVTSLGVLPFFEQLRRAMPGKLRLGVLCGTIVIIPAEAKEPLLRAVGDHQVNFSPAGRISESDYLKVTAVGDAHFLTGAVTVVFTEGYIQTLIGTKSLLGEGWDSPCINSLILASFVGSFMLSNQMRGRAIRVYKENPKKTSNIWHLVCLPPEGQKTQAVSEDYELLVRRMDHFLGLHYTEDVIESGIGRLSIIKSEFNKSNIEQMNKEMLELAGERSVLRDRWMRALIRTGKMEIAQETEVESAEVPAAVLVRAGSRLVGSLILWAASLIAACFLGGFGKLLFLLATLYCVIVSIPKYVAVSSASKRVRILAQGICEAMRRVDLLEDRSAKPQVDERGTGIFVSLKGGTSRDQNAFSQCVREMFAPVDSQRYLLVKAGGARGGDAYYNVPECFGKRKEDAQMFYECIRQCVGEYKLVYTRNEGGRKILLDARVQSLKNGKRETVSIKRLRG